MQPPHRVCAPLRYRPPLPSLRPALRLLVPFRRFLMFSSTSIFVLIPLIYSCFRSVAISFQACPFLDASSPLLLYSFSVLFVFGCAILIFFTIASSVSRGRSSMRSSTERPDVLRLSSVCHNYGDFGVPLAAFPSRPPKAYLQSLGSLFLTRRWNRVNVSIRQGRQTYGTRATRPCVMNAGGSISEVMWSPSSKSPRGNFHTSHLGRVVALTIARFDPVPSGRWPLPVGWIYAYSVGIVLWGDSLCLDSGEDGALSPNFRWSRPGVARPRDAHGCFHVRGLARFGLQMHTKPGRGCLSRTGPENH